jgi:hypothetical protein
MIYLPVPENILHKKSLWSGLNGSRRRTTLFRPTDRILRFVLQMIYGLIDQVVIIKIPGLKCEYGALFSRAEKDEILLQFFLLHDPSPPLPLVCRNGTGKRSGIGKNDVRTRSRVFWVVKVKGGLQA